VSEIAKLPLPEPIGKPKEPDWAWIEHEYRNGARSLREIAREAGVSQPAISKHAKRHGWTRLTVITPTDNQPDNQADNRKIRPEEGRAIMEAFNSGMTTGKALCEPAYAAREDDAYWRSEDAKEDIVCHRQQSIAAYRNKQGQLVIREERDWDRDEDTFIVVDKANVAALVKRICDLMGWKLGDLEELFGQ
jgi:hypothetical protein